MVVVDTNDRDPKSEVEVARLEIPPEAIRVLLCAVAGLDLFPEERESVRPLIVQLHKLWKPPGEPME